MKIALPSRMNQIDEHFGHCEHFTVFTIDGQKKITAMRECLKNFPI
jgi:predicted Fe-Mo cluster-binding NifX family protein